MRRRCGNAVDIAMTSPSTSRHREVVAIRARDSFQSGIAAKHGVGLCGRDFCSSRHVGVSRAHAIERHDELDARGFAGVSLWNRRVVLRAVARDAMFLIASALGATYLVNVEQRRLDPVVSAALVCIVSALIVLPWHYFFGESTIASAPFREIVWQMLFQGVLFGGAAFLAVNYAI